jgi:hypothetical protein
MHIRVLEDTAPPEVRLVNMEFTDLRATFVYEFPEDCLLGFLLGEFFENYHLLIFQIQIRGTQIGRGLEGGDDFSGTSTLGKLLDILDELIIQTDLCCIDTRVPVPLDVYSHE